jgi:hypothetical protein
MPMYKYCGNASTVNVPANGAAIPDTVTDSPKAISVASSVLMQA